MNIKIIGKDLTAREPIKEYVEKKLERIKKYFGMILKFLVEFV